MSDTPLLVVTNFTLTVYDGKGVHELTFKDEAEALVKYDMWIKTIKDSPDENLSVTLEKFTTKIYGEFMKGSLHPEPKNV